MFLGGEGRNFFLLIFAMLFTWILVWPLEEKNSIYLLYYPLVYSLLSLTTGICLVPFSYNLCYSEWNIICLCLWYLPFSLLGFLVRIICPVVPYSMRPDEVKKSSNLNMTKIWLDIHFTRENTWLLFRNFYQKLHQIYHLTGLCLWLRW